MDDRRTPLARARGLGSAKDGVHHWWVQRQDGQNKSVSVKLRIDTPIDIDYYRHGGILPFVLRQLLSTK